MALPEGDLSTTPVVSPLLQPDENPRLNLLEDFERGGVALNDPTQGLDVRDWRVWSDGESIWVAPVDSLMSTTLLYSGTGITEVSLAFDQNMRPTVAFVEAGTCKLQWFDSLINDVTVTTFAGATSPMLSLDDKRSIASETNDVILAYLRAGNAYYRQQRDRYTIEYLMGSAFGAVRILQMGMGTNGRLQFKMVSQPRGAHTDLLTDKIYAISGQHIAAVADGDTQTAIWRSKVFETHEQPAPAWGRVDGGYPCTLRIYGDGDLVSTTVVTGPAPFRIRPVRSREWQVEVTGSQRVVSVAMANTREELV